MNLFRKNVHEKMKISERTLLRKAFTENKLLGKV